MEDERRSGSPEDPVPVERVLLLDAELEWSASALLLDADVKRRSRSASAAGAQAAREPTEAVPADPGGGSDAAGPAGQGVPALTGKPVPVAGVEFGNVATEILDPFVRAIEVLLRGLAESFGEEMGGPATVQFGSTVIQYSSPGWGDDVVRVYRTHAGTADAALDTANAGGEAGVEAFGDGPGRRPRDRWELGASAAREGNHALALELFEEEAKEAEQNQVSQRAAIAYRSASREAGLVGRRDYANMLLRLAGKHYLLVAEEPRTSARGKVQAFVAAAKCFLQAGNLPLAESCIARARSGGEALGDLE